MELRSTYTVLHVAVSQKAASSCFTWREPDISLTTDLFTPFVFLRSADLKWHAVSMEFHVTQYIANGNVYYWITGKQTDAPVVKRTLRCNYFLKTKKITGV
jgi:hypothetical protein